jgi:transcriptional regulator with XRE-family HTH domain
MKNYIGLNIKYLTDKNNLKQDEFGLLFDLNKGVIGTYVREMALPKIEIIQRICNHYEISIDDFVNTDLSAPKAVGIKQGNLLYASEPLNYGQHEVISPRYVASLEKMIVEKEQALNDKQKIIEMLEEKLNPDKRKQA